MTATISVQAVVPIENPAIRIRPSIVPSATARSRKISGAVETIHLMVSIGDLLNLGPAGSDCLRPLPLIQIKSSRRSNTIPATDHGRACSSQSRMNLDVSSNQSNGTRFPQEETL